MAKGNNNIHSDFDTFLDRGSKEKLLSQKAKVIWLTGLSGSGKSSIAKGLEHELYYKGFATAVLDGDKVRGGINNNLGFSNEDRNENIRRVAEVAKLFLESGVICICSFVSPTAKIRATAKNIIGEEDFIEVFVNTPLEECEKRDVKGLYAKARRGEIKEFTGITSEYEEPASPDLEIKTSGQPVEEGVSFLLRYLIPLISPKSAITNTNR